MKDNKKPAAKVDPKKTTTTTAKGGETKPTTSTNTTKQADTKSTAKHDEKKDSLKEVKVDTKVVEKTQSKHSIVGDYSSNAQIPVEIKEKEKEEPVDQEKPLDNREKLINNMKEYLQEKKQFQEQIKSLKEENTNLVKKNNELNIIKMEGDYNVTELTELYEL